MYIGRDDLFAKRAGTWAEALRAALKRLAA